MLEVQIKRCAEQSFKVCFMCVLRQVTENISAVIIKDDYRKINTFQLSHEQTVDVVIHRDITDQHRHFFFRTNAEPTRDYTVNTVRAAVRKHVVLNFSVITLK